MVRDHGEAWSDKNRVKWELSNYDCFVEIGDNFHDRKLWHGIWGESFLGNRMSAYDDSPTENYEYYYFDDGCLTGFFGTIEDGVITKLGYKYEPDFSPPGGEMVLLIYYLTAFCCIAVCIYKCCCCCKSDPEAE